MDSMGAEWYFNIPNDLNGEAEEEILPLAPTGRTSHVCSEFHSCGPHSRA
jgi:hypothetical protein